MWAEVKAPQVFCRRAGRPLAADVIGKNVAKHAFAKVNKAGQGQLTVDAPGILVIGGLDLGVNEFQDILVAVRHEFAKSPSGKQHIYGVIVASFGSGLVDLPAGEGAVPTAEVQMQLQYIPNQRKTVPLPFDIRGVNVS